MKHMGSFEASVREINAQMNDTPKMDKYCKKYIIISGISKNGWSMPCSSSQSFCGHGGIIEINESIESNGPKKNWGGTSQ